jgi:hypothetical protein
LQGTDKNNPDTDGDGYSDGLEVRTESDPLDPLNTKKVEKEDLEKINFRTYDYRLDQDLNRTEKMAYEFLDLTMQLKRDGMEKNTSAQEDIVRQMIEHNSIAVNLMKYKISDLNISSTISAKDSYEQWIKILEDLKDEELMDESLLLALYLKDNHQQKYLDMIAENTSVLRQYVDKLIDVEIPVKIAKEYLNYINAFYSTIETNQHYALAREDLVSSAQALGVSKEVDSNFSFRVRELNSYFNKLIKDENTF